MEVIEKLPAISKISGKDLQLKKDREVKKNIDALRASARAIENLTPWLYGELDIEVNKTRGFAAKVLNSIIPRKLYDYFPAVAEFVAEETDASYFMESHLRDNVNNVMGVVKNLKRSAEHEEEQWNQLLEDIKTAEDEKWDAGTLQEHIAKLSDITVDPEVQALLDAKSELLTPEEKEIHRLNFLNRLRANADGRKKIVRYHGKICSLGLDVLTPGMFQYFDFVTIIRPLRVIQDAAKGLVEMDKSLYAAKDVVVMYATLSAAALGHVADATAKVHQYAISSPDMSALFESMNEHLEGKLKMLEKTRNKLAVLEEQRQKVLKISDQRTVAEAETVEAQPAA